MYTLYRGAPHKNWTPLYIRTSQQDIDKCLADLTQNSHYLRFWEDPDDPGAIICDYGSHTDFFKIRGSSSAYTTPSGRAGQGAPY